MTHDAMLKAAAVTETVMQTIERKLRHQVPPLTHQECCLLFKRATGRAIPTPRKRCSTCDGVGKRRTIDPWRSVDGVRAEQQDCADCNGSGYQNMDF